MSNKFQGNLQKYSGEQGIADQPPDSPSEGTANSRLTDNLTHNVTHNSGEVPQFDFEHRLEHRPDDSFQYTQDNNLTGEDNHSTNGNLSDNQSERGNSSGQPDQVDAQQTMYVDRPVEDYAHGRDVISPTIPPFTQPSPRSADRDAPSDQAVNIQPARRPLTGERMEPVARRMRTVGPRQHEEQPEQLQQHGDWVRATLGSGGTSVTNT